MDFLNNFSSGMESVEWFDPESSCDVVFLSGMMVTSSYRPRIQVFANITKDSPVEEQLRKGSYRLDNGKSSNVSGDLHGNYATTIGKHSILAMGGFGISNSHTRLTCIRPKGSPIASLQMLHLLVSMPWTVVGRIVIFASRD